MIDNYFEGRSICVVDLGEGEKLQLVRLCDIMENGELKRFSKMDFEPPRFGNRELLYYNYYGNPPIDYGQTAIWEWTARPNDNNPERDYIQSALDPSSIPIQVLEVKSAQDDASLYNAISTGITAKVYSKEILLYYRASRGVLRGILCDIKDIIVSNGTLTYRSEEAVIPIYVFTPEDVVRVGGYSFYHNLTLPKAEEKYRAKLPFQLCKDLLLKRAIWQGAKAQGITKANWQGMRQYLESISGESLYQEVSRRADCTEDEAQKIIEKLIDDADRYVTDADIDQVIPFLERIVNNSNVLTDRFTQIAEEKWKSENIELTEQAERNLRDLNTQVDGKQKELDELQDTIRELKEEQQLLLEENEKRRQTVEDANQYVSERINQARDNIAEFLGQSIIYQALGNSGYHYTKATHPEPEAAISIIRGTDVSLGDVHEDESWQDTLFSISVELEHAGVKEELSRSFSAVLYSAFINQIPVLLAGPNGESIGHAFSAALYNRYADVLCCEGQYKDQECAISFSEGKGVLVINNAFQGGWFEGLLRYTQQHRAFYIFTLPYAEDLSLEPNGIFNYVIPICTEWFIENPSDDDYEGSIMTDVYKAYKRPEICGLITRRLYRDFGASPLHERMIKEVMTDAHVMDPDQNNALDYLFALAPYYWTSSDPDDREKVIADDMDTTAKEILQRFIKR